MTSSLARVDLERLGDGDRLPELLTPPPGPASRAASRALRAQEAPGVNTLYRDRDGSATSVVWAAARGSNVLDLDGNRYLDLTSGFGVATLGHRHPRVVDAVVRQADALLHGLGDVAAHPPRLELTRRLAELAPMPDARCHLAVSGADAIEVALKTALLAAESPQRRRLLVFEPAYHGLTLGALAVTSRPAFRQPFTAHLHPRVDRLPFGCALERVDEILSGAPEAGDAEAFAAVVVEPIVGREGVLLPPPGWLAGLAERAQQHGALFIADEIFTAFGKTGTRWVTTAEGVEPDLVCCGKALGGGLPIGAVVGRASVLGAWATDGEALHTGTFLGHPLAMAAACAALEAMDSERVEEQAHTVGEAIDQRVSAWPERFDEITTVRGRGALWGVEFTTARAAGSFAQAALGHGILLLAGGPEGRVAQLVPPATITSEQLDAALDRLEDCLKNHLGDRPDSTHPASSSPRSAP